MWQLSDSEFLVRFTPPPRQTCLAQRFPMRREDRIVFDESTHTYFVDGAKVPLSVTGVIHRYAREFDAHEVLRRMAPEKKTAPTTKKFCKCGSALGRWQGRAGSLCTRKSNLI